MNTNQNRAKSIFLNAAEIASPPEREVYLAAQCGEDEVLRREVADLLKHHGQAGDFLESPAPKLGATTDEPVTERPGTVIGPYKLLEQIGEGGFGVVFMAEQTQPVRRKVALKVLKPGMDTRQVVARFEAERQALAIMDHPNIAKVFDGGATGESSGSRQTSGSAGTLASSATGRPYFVMELVKGVPITEFCDHNQLTPRERLELFIPVCQAVQHAHQKGIIHRDLKPSNVLVSRHDTTPLVKVIDFGVAKALGQELTDKTLFTAIAQMIGTPLYMSPEQAGMSDLDVDTRSDIYSLGVLLYELLTGTTPFDKERFQEVGYDEMRRIIREEEPPRPSTRISTLAQAATTVTAQRQSDPKRLSQLFRGELDWIVMKGLEKDRNRRYETANAFAADVQRYLHDEPVQACPPSLGYRLRKFVRRNKGPVLAATFVALALVCGIIGTTWAMIRASNATDQAVAETKQKAKALQGEQAALAQVRRQERQAKIALSNFLLYKGLGLIEQGDVDLGMLWLARSLENAPEDAADLQRALRRNLASWPNQTGGLHAILAPSGAVRKVAFSADGKTLLTVSANGKKQLNDKTFVDVGEVRSWDADTGEPIGLPIPHQGFPIESVAVSPDGKMALTGKDNQTAQLWDLAAGQPRGAPLQHPNEIRIAAFSADGRTLVTLTDKFDGKTVRSTNHLWETATATPVGKPVTFEDQLSVVALSPDGQIVLTASMNKPPQLWRTTTGEPLGPPLPHPDHVITAVFSPDGKRLLVGGPQRLSTGGVPREGATNWRYSSMKGRAGGWVISPDSIAVAYGSNKPEVWAAGRGAPYSPMGRSLEHRDPVNVAAISPDGLLIATGSGQAVRLWWTDVLSHGTFGVPMPHPGGITALAFSPDSQSLLTACADGTARLWDLPRPVGRESWPLGDDDFNPLTALSADGKTLLRKLEARPFRDFFAQVWDVTTHKALGPMLPVGYSGVSAASPDGRKVLLFVPSYKESRTGPDGARIEQTHPAVFWLWQAGEWQRLPCPPEVTLTYRDLMAFGPGGSTVLLGHRQEGRARLWDLATWTALGPPLEHPSVSAVAVAPDGRTVVTAGGREARLWDALTGRQIGPSLPHQGEIAAVAFSPDGRAVATGSSDHTARLWNVATGEPIGLPLIHPQGVRAVAFSPDGATILTAGTDQKVRFWDAGTGRPLGPPWYARAVNAVAFSGDGTSALARTRNSLYRWAMPPPPPEADAKRFVLWVEMMTGRNLDAAEVVGWLTPQDWNERRKRLLARGGPPVPTPDKLAWHRHWAEAFKRDNVYRTRWHLDRLIAAEPGQWKYYLARGKSLRAQEAIADYSQAIALGAEGPEAWERRAFAYGYLEQWKKAAADYQEAARRGAGDEFWCRHAGALWMAGQTDAYRLACVGLLDRLGQTNDARIAHFVAHVGLLDPRPQVDLRRVVRLAEKALTESFEAPSEDEDFYRPNEVKDVRPERGETLALALYRAGQLEAAIQCLNQRPKEDALRRDRRSQTHWFVLALAQQRLGRADLARECLVQAAMAFRPYNSFWRFVVSPSLRLEAEALIGLPPNLAEAYYRAGLNLEEKKQWNEAIGKFREAIRLKQDYVLAHHHLGNVYRQQGKLEEAIAAYRQALRLQENNVETRTRLASALSELALQHLAAFDATLFAQRLAVELAEEAVKLAPTERRYWNTLGMAHFRAAQHKAAIAALEKSMELANGGDSSDWFFLAMAQWKLGEKELARTWNAAALVWMEKFRSDDESLYRAAIEAAQLLGLPQPSRPAPRRHPTYLAAVWTRVLEVKPGLRVALDERDVALKEVADGSNRMGLSLLRERKLDRAMAEFRRALAAKPDYGAALFNLSVLLANGPDPKLREPHQAIELAKRGLTLRESRHDAGAGWWQTLGWAYYRAGAWKESIAALDKSIELYPAGADADQWLFLAMAHWQLGHKQEARKWYDMAVDWIDKNTEVLDKQKRNRLTVDDVGVFRAEAAKLLGVPEKK